MPKSNQALDRQLTKHNQQEYDWRRITAAVTQIATDT